MWYDRCMMKFSRWCAAGLMGLIMLTGASGDGCKSSKTPSGGGSTHKQQPMPNPDPARPQPGRSFPGNVSITFWLEQRGGQKTITTYNIGAGPVVHNCTDSCHWSVTTKPNQLVSFVTVYFVPGTQGHLAMQVVQDNNGRIVCQDNNDDKDGHGGIDGSGTIVI